MEETLVTTTTDNTLTLPGVRKQAHKLNRGRTWILAAGDVAVLIVAYATTFIVSEQIGPLRRSPLPAGSSPLSAWRPCRSG